VRVYQIVRWVGVYPAKGERGVKGFPPGEAQGLRIGYKFVKTQ